MVLDKSSIGKSLKKDGTTLIKHVEALADEDKQELDAYFEREAVKVN